VIVTGREELEAEIKAAFGSVAFPSHQGLRGSMAMDSYATDAEVEAITVGQDIRGEWWQIPLDELRYCSLALSYLDAAGVLFYLPAYLVMALDDVGKRRLWVLDIVDTALGDDDPGHRAYKEGRLSRLNGAQRKVCVHALQFLRSQLIDDGSTEYERHRIERTLNDSYWRAFCA
jgi:hypothetical protein